MKWDERYMQIARDVAQWSKDPSRKIGAVIIGEKGQIISQGYNGFPRGIKDSNQRLTNRELKYKYVVHAEANAIYNALYNGSSVNGATIYVTGLPVCHECAKALIQAGIKRVVMDYGTDDEKWQESGSLSIDMFDEVGIEWSFLEDK